MIPARKSRWFGAWFARHCEARLRRSFDEVRVHGLARLRDAARTGPVLVVSNHTAWWDPLLVIWLTQRHLGLDSYALMNAANLRRLPFFAKLGAFGADLDDARDGARAIRHAARLLDAPRRLVWIFAQGDERPVTEPLRFRPGSARIARLAPEARVVPLALRYEMGNVERPRLLASIGEPLDLPSTEEQERAVAEELERLDRFARAKHYDALELLLAARRSRLDVIAERALAWLTRGALRS